MNMLPLRVLALVTAIVAAGCSTIGHDRFVEGKTGTLSGLILIKGLGPMADGTLLFFTRAAGPPAAENFWKLPAAASRIDQNGRFVARLVEGEYFVGAVERTSDGKPARPREDDVFFLSYAPKGDPLSVTVHENQRLDLGVLSARPLNGFQDKR